VRHRVIAIGLITAAFIGLAQPVGAATITPSLVKVIDTSTFAQPATDPMGIGYNSTTNRLLLTDSEVEETVPGQSAPCCWHNVNYWELSLTGSVLSTSDLTSFSTEPTDVGHNPANGHYFISDDNAHGVWEITPGGDGRIGTSDDTRVKIVLGYDAEGVDYGGGSLWTADGKAKLVHRIQPGANGKFEGAGDDILTQFDVAALGLAEAEDVFYDAQNGTLFIGSRKNTTVIETTLTGSLLNSYNLANTGMKNVSGLVIAPTSNNASKRSLYIADRGLDNDSTPTENDGKIFEYLLGAALPPGHPPAVTNPGAQASFEGEAVSLPIVASDEDGDTLTFSVVGLPGGLSINSGTGVISGTITTGAQTGSPYTVQVTASDGPRSGSATFPWTIKDLNPPAAPTGLAFTAQSNALALDWGNNGESDLAGYNVYRSPSGSAGSFTKLNAALLTASDYLDLQATVGGASFYEIRAADRSGNESPALTGNAIRSPIAFLAATTKSASAASLVINKPAGVAAGDVLLAGIAVRGAPTLTTPSGWTKVMEHTTTGSTPLRQAVYAKLAGASEPSTYTFTYSTSVRSAGTIVSYRGAALPVAAFAGQPNASAKSITAPSLTPASAGMEVGFFGVLNSSAVAPPPGMLEQAELAYSSYIKIETADDVVDPVALGTRVATAATAGLNVGQVVLLRPANKTPVVTNPGPQTNLENDVVSLSITATDEENETITFGATGLPPGLTIGSGTGLITGTIALNASANSPYTTTITAKDGTTTGSATITWTVNDLVAPAAPTGFTSSSQTTALLADWANSPEGDLAGYNIFRSPTGEAGSFTKLNTTPFASSNFTDTGAPAGNTSFYQITAVDRSGNESPALAVSGVRAKIEFIGSASANGNVTTLTIGKPAGATAGDLLLAVVGSRGAAAITAAGWTKITELPSSGSTPLRQALFSKPAGASEPSTYGFVVGSSAVPATGTISVYRGAASPVAAFGGQANASATSITAPSLTSTTAASVEVGFFGNAVSTTMSPPAGMIEQAETTISSTSNKITIETADDVVDPGALGTRVATAAAAGVSIGQVVILQPNGPQPPVVTNPGPQQNFEGDVVNKAITATDAEGDPITYSAGALPPGLSINSATGVITGTVGVGASAASPYQVTVTATDTTGSSSATFVWTIKDPNAPVPSSFDVVVAAASDDAEESPAGAVDLSSSDIELVTDGTAVQTVGVRFAGIGVPGGASITAAWIQFQADEASTEATILTIKGQAADNAATFTTAASSISSRPRTTAAVPWTPAAWNTVGEAGANQRTPDLKAVVQEIVSRFGWGSNQAMAFIFTGTGRRVAEPFEGGPLDPALHIEYTTGPPPPPANARPVVTNPGPQSSVEGNLVTLPIQATDAESNPITYGATGLPSGLSIDSGSGVISGTVGAGAAASSPYTVNVTASDAGGPGSATFTWTVTDGSTPPPTPTSINVVMSAAGDDMEEQANGTIDSGSSDLELVAETSLQTVGLRFAGVSVPAGATITAAWIQFQVDEVSTGACNLLVQGEAADNAGAFTTAAFNVSSRPRTSSGAAWVPPDWPTIGAAGAAQQTSNLAAVLQEIVSRPGWGPGQAMAVIITGTGKRVAESFEGGPLDPTLHIEYTI
jgi:putative Ig domain-containing protein